MWYCQYKSFIIAGRHYRLQSSSKVDGRPPRGKSFALLEGLICQDAEHFTLVMQFFGDGLALLWFRLGIHGWLHCHSWSHSGCAWVTDVRQSSLTRSVGLQATNFHRNLTTTRSLNQRLGILITFEALRLSHQFSKANSIKYLLYCVSLAPWAEVLY